MTIYLCPSDKKYTCSWEGPAEDILLHFEQEHDDLLFFSDTFTIDLMVPSENRLFLIDEEIYLMQMKMYEKILSIKLRYLGPARFADRITYNILVTIVDEVYPSQHITTTKEGSIEADLSKLEQEFPNVRHLKCTLNITKNFISSGSDDSVFLDDQLETKDLERVPVAVSSMRKLSAEDISTSSKEKPSPGEVFLSRSQTTSFEEIKRKNVKRTKSTLSLGPIQENEYAISCFECRVILQPPIFLCPCGQNFCIKCQVGCCKLCDEKITNQRNLELEKKYTKFLYPCKYKRLGCPQKVFYGDLHQHEVNCSFCEYDCPMDECSFKGQYKGLCKHLKLIHGSTKILESFILVFNNIPQAFLVNEERGIFYCYAKYFQDSVLWEARFCGPKEKVFFCELKFKDGKLKQPILLKRTENVYSVNMGFSELKRMKLKAKNAILTITC